MSEITTVIPTVLIHEIVNGGSLTGVAPAGKVYTFDYDNEASGPFQANEELTWGTGPTAGAGVITVLVDNGSDGTITIALASGVPPSDGLEVTGGTSSATGDVDGDVVLDSDTSDSVETIRRGRYRQYSNLADGGLISIAEANAYNGYRVRNVLVSAAGLTAVSFYIVDRDGGSSNAGSITLTSGDGYNEWRNGGLIVAPGCSFKAVGTGTASAEGRIMFVLGEGWGSSAFDGALEIGSSNLPPGMVRP